MLNYIKMYILSRMKQEAVSLGKLKISSKMCSVVLTLSLIFTSMPIVASAAPSDTDFPIPTKESEGSRYNPEFQYDEEYYNNIVDSVRTVKAINRLPSYDEFVEATGYSHRETLSLTQFREKYGIYDEFGQLEAGMPSNDVHIQIKTVEEFLMLPCLVGGLGQFSVTEEERMYYSSATYDLVQNLNINCERFYPIGTANSPFNGSFDGRGFVISNIKISGDSVDTYPSDQFLYFGIFGCIGNNGTVKNLGINDVDIDLPYTVGADVGVLSGRNYGVISDCYVAGKSDSKVIVSNATVGGIAAENYGTITNTYSDFYADVSITTGSYSEPQPISAVNSGTINNSYYIFWQNVADNSPFTLADDNGDNPCLIGWKAADYTGFNGTGLSFDDFLTELPGTHFSSGTTKEDFYNYYYNPISLYDFIEQVGTGDSFDLQKAQNILSQPNTRLCLIANNYYGNDVWNTFADLVNHEAENETDAEQQFYANADVSLGGYDYEYHGYYSEHYKHYNKFSLYCYSTYAALPKSIGCEAYPFNGTFDGNNCEFLLDYDTDSYNIVPTLFGVIGSSAEIKNLAIYGYIYYDSSKLYNLSIQKGSGILCGINNGHIHDCIISAKTGTATETGLYHNYPVVDAGNNLYISLKDGDLMYSYAVENNGTIEDCDSLLYFTADYYDSKKYIKQGINAVKVNNGTVRNLYVGDSAGYMDGLVFNNIGTKIEGFTRHAYSASPDDNGVLNQSFNISIIDKYPEFVRTKPRQNSDGKYMIYTAEDLDYFIHYGQGESLILMNTIDMYEYIYIGDLPGYFDIDGTLTDENDVCSYIDLGTGTKCYGILNLSMNGSSLSLGFAQGHGKWSNIYFIGGDIKAKDTYRNKYYGEYNQEERDNFYKDFDSEQQNDAYPTYNAVCVYLIGRELTNVHYNWTVSIGGWDSQAHVVLALSKYATLCSSCGTVSNYGQSISMLGHNSTKCDSYLKVSDNSFVEYWNNNRYCIYDLYCIGYNVSYSTTHASGAAYGMGHNVDHCRYDSRSNANLYYVFGKYVTDSVFNGVINGSHGSKYYNTFGDQLSNFVFDTDGIVNNCFTGMRGDHILFKGTVNVVADDKHSDTAIFGLSSEGAVNEAINIGVINITVNDKPCNVFGMGYLVNGSMNGQINILGEADINASKTNIYYYGTCSDDYYGYAQHSQNYSDIIYHNENVRIGTIGIFSYAGGSCENYGNIDVTGYVDKVFAADGAIDFINYGDARIGGSVDKFYFIAIGYGGYYGACLYNAKNYGNITANLQKHCDIAAIKYSDSNPTDRVYTIGDYVYNTGNIDISGVSNNLKVLGSCYINYGDILIHDISLTGGCSITGSRAFSLGKLTLTDFSLNDTRYYYDYNIVGLAYKEPRDYYSWQDSDDYRFWSSRSANEIKKDVTSHGKLYGQVVVQNGTDMNFGNVHVKSGKMSVYDNAIKSIHIEDVPYTSDFTTVDCHNNTCSDTFSVSNNGQNDVVIRNSTIKNIKVDMGNIDNVNFGSCYIHDIDNSSSIVINSPVAEASNPPVYSYINTGNYTVKNINTNEGAELYVNGTTFVSSTTNASLNTGDFDIEFAGNIKVQGIGGSNDGILINSINAGNITVKQLNPDCKTYVGAISCSRLSRAAGLINYGDISVDGIKIRDEQFINSVNDVQNIITSTVDVSREIYDFINYGDMSINVVDVEDGADVNKIHQFIGFFTTSQYVWFSAASPVGRGFSLSQDTRFDASIGCNFGTFTSNYGNSFMRGASAVSYSVSDELTGYQGGSRCDSIVDLNQDTINTKTDYVNADTGNHMTSNLLFANCTLSDIIKPNFCFRRDNLYEQKYINTEDKIQVNGLNDFEYADMDEFLGLTAAKLMSDYSESAGSYALCGVVYQPLSGTGATLEEVLTISPIRGTSGRDLETFITVSDVMANRLIATKWGNRSLKSLLANELKQRNDNTWVEFGSQNPFNVSDMIQTVKSYTSKAGGSEQISSKTSLIYEQLPGVCSNGRYSNNTLTTIMDIYVPFEDYNIPNVSLLKYKVGTIPVTSGAKFKVFKQPIVAEDTADLKNKMKELMTDENTTVLGEVSENSVINLPYKSDSDIVCYAVIGAAVSNDGRRINLLGIRVHAVSILASAQIKDVSYPTDINSDGSGLIYSKFAAESDSDNSVYDTTYESVDAGDEGHVVYPVYTLKNDMYHYTDGAFVKNNKNKWTNSLADEENCKVTMSLDFVNAKGYQIIYNDDLGLPFEMFDASSMVMSDDGTHLSVSKKDIDLSKFKNKNYKFYSYYGDYRYISYGSLDDLSSRNRSDYIFTNGGEYTLTVYGVPYATNDDSKRVILCKIVFNRELSPENYLKTKDYGFTRCDVIHSDGVSSYTRNVDKFDLAFCLYYMNFSIERNDKLNQTYSRKASVDAGSPFWSNNTARFEGDVKYSDFVQSDDHMTYYPSHVHSLATIRAENGDTADYVCDSWLRDKPEYIPLSSLTSGYGDSGYISGNAYVLADNSTQAYFIVNYDKNSITPSSTTPYLKCLKVYNSSGELVDTVERYDRYDSSVKGCYWANIQFEPYMSNENGLYLYVKPSQNYYGDKDIDFDKFTDDFYTFVPVLAIDHADESGIEHQDYYIELDSFQIHKTKLSLHRAVNVHWDKTLVTSAISTQANELSNDVDIFGSGVIDYTNTPDETNHFYISNCVEPNLAKDDMHIELPPLASLQENINGEWTTVFSAGSSREYIKHFNYTREELLAGVDYQFRIIAQDYDESDDVLKTHVSYYNTRINASMRNKLVSIEFDTGEETMNLYREILSNHGNTAIQVKNMNGTNAVFQQTKLYTGTSEANMASTYYKLSQGDYAIDVQVPSGYTAKVKIVGGSSEGYLQAHSEVKGDRVRMPYANAQTIRLVVYLERGTSSETWGVAQYASSYAKVRNNLV